jgi:hypothetical protein
MRTSASRWGKAPKAGTGCNTELLVSQVLGLGIPLEAFTCYTTTHADQARLSTLHDARSFCSASHLASLNFWLGEALRSTDTAGKRVPLLPDILK